MMNFVRRRWFHWTAALLLALGATAETRADHVVYATADNGTTFLFGTMDLTSGQFTQIATTTPLFGSITGGAGGTLYGGEGNLNFNLDTISPSGVTSQFGSVTAPSNSFGFTGLASAGAAGFYAIYQIGSLPGPFSATLEHISADGNSSNVVGTLSTSFWSFNSGNLAFGPNGNLYFNVWPTPSDVATLYQVNTTTGAATAVGSGLGTSDPLALVSVGSTLYGIDTFIPSDSVDLYDQHDNRRGDRDRHGLWPAHGIHPRHDGRQRTGACHDHPPRHRRTCASDFLSVWP